MKLDALKRPSALRTPIPNAAPQMKIMYGSSVLTRRIVISSRLVSLSPSASRKCTATSSPPMHRTTIAPSIRSTIVITERASRAARSIEPASASPLKTGTNAAVSAPSPKSLRAMLGIANARVNAACSMPAPISRDWSISRASPSTRESIVNAPTVKTFLMVLVPLLISLRSIHQGTRVSLLRLSSSRRCRRSRA